MSNINRLEIAILTRSKWQNLTVRINSWKKRKKKIFKAFTYTKQKRIKKLPIITYSDRNNKRKDIITFNQKYDTFLTSLFYPPPASEPPNWSNHIKKEWE